MIILRGVGMIEIIISNHDLSDSYRISADFDHNGWEFVLTNKVGESMSISSSIIFCLLEKHFEEEF